MSSAILYVAIVAIWACVLIPRWLHRGTTAAVTVQADHSSERAVPSPQHSPSSSLDVEAEVPGERDEPEPEREPGPGDSRPGDSRPGDSRPGDSRPGDSRPGDSQPRVPLSREESRRRMLAARRRLLLMLLALEAAAVALTMLNLAALWVPVPPTIMLAGYLLLLREVSRADAERAQRETEDPRARAAARARERESRTAAPPAPASPAEEAPPAPAPEDYSDLGHGRDFAPGLAGKYMPSNSDVIDLSEYKRAVGD